MSAGASASTTRTQDSASNAGIEHLRAQLRKEQSHTLRGCRGASASTTTSTTTAASSSCAEITTAASRISKDCWRKKKAACLVVLLSRRGALVASSQDSARPCHYAFDYLNHYLLHHYLLNHFASWTQLVHEACRILVYEAQSGASCL